MRTAEKLTSRIAYHGEGPFWDSRSNRLLCMDALAGAVIALDANGAIRRHSVPSRVVTVVRRRTRGGFVLATERGLLVADDALEKFEPFTTVVHDTAVRTNDGGCDPYGGFVIGTMSYAETPDAGAVYRVTADRVVTKILAPVTISNGVQWSGDGRRAYYIDTPTRRVDTFNVEPHSGAWSGRAQHVRLGDEADGFPDGMAIDDEDGVWIALWGGGAVHHYDAEGQLVERIWVPGVSQVSSCAFGGINRDVLYVTTSRQGLADNDEPDAGAIFAVQTSVQGALGWDFPG
ncbi:SMP-30/gluconolactonase/LRE family protein [Mycolicibacterium litorale]|uniref:SMP-30/gluconolactonase/LRE family protein n=1 Tax=Mycolicibacterium litorale TaxID=758802 RepID=UPI0039A3F3A7